MPTWLNTKVLGGIAVALLLIGAFFWHRGQVNSLREEAFDNGVKHEQARIKAWTDDIILKAGKVSENAQKLAQKDFSRIRSSGRTVLVRGAGKAACSPTVPGSASQHLGPNSAGSSSVDGVHADQGQPLFGMPVAGAITLAENHDLCWARERAWVKWYSEQSEIWRKSN